MYVLVLAVVGQIKWQNVEPVISSLVADESSLLAYLEIYNTALQLWRFEVPKCLQIERVVEH